MRFIDLYSDARTKPTRAMRQFMLDAEVGDEQEGEDPTVNALIAHVCDMLGKEDAVFLPSGTMCNEIALRVHCRPAEEIICHESAHIIHFESGGPAALSGAMIRPLSGPRGRFTADQLRAVVRCDERHGRYAPISRLVVIEQTANLAGGAVWPIEQIDAVCDAAHALGLCVHMDGARLLNACAASGCEPRRMVAGSDSVWLDFTKGLGAPVGAMLAGSKDFIRQAWRLKQQWGGSMRQAGIIAAGGLYALRHHVERLPEDHANAKALARGLSKIGGITVDPDLVETNIVFFELPHGTVSANEFVLRLRSRGVGLGAFGPFKLRAVTHFDIEEQEVRAALEEIGRAVAELLPSSKQGVAHDS